MTATISELQALIIDSILNIQLFEERLPEGHPLILDAEAAEHLLCMLSDRLDVANKTYVKQIPVTRSCVGCFQSDGHAYGCPTGQNGPPNYS